MKLSMLNSPPGARTQPGAIRLYRAFADPTRLRILNLLAARDELCVCDIIDILRLPQARVSRHLAYLRTSGLVSARKVGLWAYYQMLPAASPAHQALLDSIQPCRNETVRLRRDIQTLQKKSCRTDCC